MIIRYLTLSKKLCSIGNSVQSLEGKVDWGLMSMVDWEVGYLEVQLLSEVMGMLEVQ